MDDLAIIIGERIKNIRKSKNMSQETLAHECGLQPAYIGQLERGEKNATLKSINRIAQALGFTLEELFRNLQPISGNNDEILIKIYNLLQGRSVLDHKALLNVIDGLIDWKDS